MTIEEALRQIAAIEPVESEESGYRYCMYCGGTEEYTGTTHIFVHDAECAWTYLQKTLEEDDRIERALSAAFPGLFTHTK